MSEKSGLCFVGQPLGVMAPNAFQGASLKENGGANPRSVMDTKLLYIKNSSYHNTISSL